MRTSPTARMGELERDGMLCHSVVSRGPISDVIPITGLQTGDLKDKNGPAGFPIQP